MRWIIWDAETFYSSEYSLTKMTTVEYILDPRFQMFGAAVAEGSEPARWIEADDLPAWFASLDPDDVCLIHHNALFDACIVSWKYDFRPRITADTLAMARGALNGKLKSFSLKMLARYMGAGEKGDVLASTRGMTLVDLRLSPLWGTFMQYACNDVELTRDIFWKLVPLVPPAEFAWIDLVIRMATMPSIFIDQRLVAEHLNEVRENKAHLLSNAQLLDPDVLMSNDKFAMLLSAAGVEPPTKISLATGKVTFAFAKTDPAFIALEDHPDPTVQALVAARLGHKSTLEETRSERFMKISTLIMPDGSMGMMPVPLNVSGAHTHRLSGADKLNLQNLPRGGKLRHALVAPSGCKLIAVDARQIEARIVAWLCKQKRLIDAFENDEDVYCLMASTIFNRPVTKADKMERWMGKTSVLGLGYEMGWERFQRFVETQSQAQLGEKIVLDDKEAKDIVYGYRRSNDKIQSTWHYLGGEVLELMRQDVEHSWGPFQMDGTTVILPDGMKLFYDRLRIENNQWVFTRAGNDINLFGGKMLENFTQALAFVLIKHAMIRMRTRFAQEKLLAHLIMQVHDEAVAVARDECALRVREIMLEEMRRRPEWALSLPLDAEASLPENNYGLCK